MMMSHNSLTGTLILITGVILLIFIAIKLYPAMKKDHDATVLLAIFSIIAVALVGMGGWLCI
ncbi:hypothetical protein [Levilactobacillus lindianensis]|uniref:hypothetical protein n=1 Tax=Levilactobacillus lindianensis TaxID=2486018 RepID=UPI000F7402F8|nr:hypothetical protein [Levilactobacillus lindianensis]